MRYVCAIFAVVWLSVILSFCPVARQNGPFPALFRAFFMYLFFEKNYLQLRLTFAMVFPFYVPLGWLNISSFLKHNR